MNREQAKEILSAFRPGSEDERDPVFVEALRLAQSDPDLAAWVKERQAFDAAVSRRLSATSLPPNLLETVKAGVARRRAGHHRRNVLLALAACFAVMATVAALWFGNRSNPGETRFAMFRQDMVQYLDRFPRLDLETESLAEARQWLSDTHHLRQVKFPSGLTRFPTIGCRSLEWHGREPALVCFMVDGEVVHLIVIPKADIPGGPQTLKPLFARVGGMSTASWSSGNLTYLLLSKASESFLRERM